MELAEVKKHFENAKEVQDHAGDKGFVELDKIKLSKDGVNSFIQNPFKKNWIVLYHHKKGFAKILTTKEPSFSITKNQLRQLTDPKVKEWFPEVFEVKLEVGKWYLEEGTSFLYYPTEIKDENNINAYGFTLTGRFSEDNGSFEWGTPKRFREATNEEVFEALKNEAVKRGFVEGVSVKTLHGTEKRIRANFVFKDNYLKSFFDYDGMSSLIFKNGKWATIIQTITKSEAEKLLNKKIID